METIVFYLLTVKIYQFRAKDSEIKPYPVCLGNISNDNMKKPGLKGDVKAFFVDYVPINNIDIIDIHRFLMKET